MLGTRVIFVVLLCVVYSTVSAKTVLVYAGTGEIGQFVVRALCRDGYDVIIAARSKDKFQKLKEGVQRHYPTSKISYIGMDYTNVDGFDVSSLTKVGLSGVVLIPPRPIFKSPKGMKQAGEWEAVLKANFIQPLVAFQKVVPYLSMSASVVVFSGITSKQYSTGYENTNVVRMSWAGEVKNLMYQLSDKKIRVNAVSPGLILTPFNQKKMAARASEQKISVGAYLKQSTEKLPLQRYGQPDEVADVVAFLVSERARYLNGVNLLVDGGESVAY